MREYVPFREAQERNAMMRVGARNNQGQGRSRDGFRCVGEFLDSWRVWIGWDRTDNSSQALYE
jgi:hypothetical protein